MDEKQHVYIIGSKGIPAKYGGFETFVEKLTAYQVEDNIQYHVACMTENSAKSGITEKHFEHNGAKCFNIDVPDIGPAKAIYYDIASLKYAIQLAESNQDKQPIFYILACRIGPFIGSLKKKIKQLDGKLFVNPDGHEWMRAKWSYPVRRYWKYSERLMVKHADLLICDSKNIEKYIKEDYQQYTPQTTYIAYGTDLEKSKMTKMSSEVTQWYKEKNVQSDNYYLVVGRFVPENNYEIMIREFMKSDTKKDFVLITNVEKNKFYDKLKRDTNFDQDPRIKFVGTVYDQELLKYIRENAYAYIHGHEVGGTNPSLLEAMASTKINLLLDVPFNQEVGRNEAYYWKKDSLAKLINSLEDNSKHVPIKSRSIISEYYSLELISTEYEALFLEFNTK
ncbi:beta 1-4 rhamnosyltransferase Cps2T [Enterococcus xiangfangensis]|uniref:Glycosyltransferase family 1 protein n=1 Tax=Enterococcus xiangfangensis TaxID=1296537 RepID=A0ABU3F7K9_9ENTE|nr:glycosyltransferase family 1 protein [Enterococcus xiangfangensis]MDT2758656.1 glycosyltransferase family 1 protein [Enterococcus xiangfangensis]